MFRNIMLALGALSMAAPATVSAHPIYSRHGQYVPHTHNVRSHYRRDYRNDYRRNYNQRSTVAWRGRDGRLYCRRDNGTTGLVIGGAAGALLGREIDGGRDRAVGTIVGGVAGALLGRSIDRRNCR